MIFNCPVKHNGVYYSAGMEVPVEDNKKPTVEKSAVGVNVDTIESDVVKEDTPKKSTKKKATKEA